MASQGIPRHFRFQDISEVLQGNLEAFQGVPRKELLGVSRDFKAVSKGVSWHSRLFFFSAFKVVSEAF